MFVVGLDDLMTLPGFKFYQSVEIILLEINETTHMLKFKHLHKHFTSQDVIHHIVMRGVF